MMTDDMRCSPEFVETVEKIFMQHSKGQTYIPFSSWHEIVSFSNPHLTPEEINTSVSSAREFFEKIGGIQNNSVHCEQFKTFYMDGALHRAEAVVHDLAQHGYNFRYSNRYVKPPRREPEYLTSTDHYGHESMAVLTRTASGDSIGVLTRQASSDYISIPYTMTPTYESQAQPSVLCQTPQPQSNSPPWQYNVQGDEQQVNTSSPVTMTSVVLPTQPTYPVAQSVESMQSPIVPRVSGTEMGAMQYIPAVPIGGNFAPHYATVATKQYQYPVEATAVPVVHVQGSPIQNVECDLHPIQEGMTYAPYQVPYGTPVYYMPQPQTEQWTDC